MDDGLMERLNRMSIAPPDAALSFERRLERERGWTHGYTQAVIREYRRFLFMAARCGAPITPSDDVDHAWHLHLTYTLHYWEELCPNILGRPLHHTPTEGGPDERCRYHAQYAATLALYRETFGERPPGDIWPDPDTRFVVRPRRRSGRPFRLGAALAAGLMLTGCTAHEANMVTIMILFMAVCVTIDLMRDKKGKGGGSGDFDFCGDGGGDSGCGGGCGGGCG